MDEYTITVYRDHPEWDKHDKWFKVPQALLEELYVARYIVRGEDVDYCDIKHHAKAVHAMHPDCVLIY